mmetsp:Transcript_31059/g.89780  ORF Transcript_31059/g.89780 Transcript_31059/m.89780 type:complete len:247 (-) Transcript_31059:124-864(-)
MEPLIVVASGAIAVGAACRTLQIGARMLASPMTLPEFLADSTVSPAAEMFVVAVSIHGAQLAPCAAAKHVWLRVKYGRAGQSVSCDTHRLPAPPAPRVGAAQFSRRLRDACAVPVGETCLFRADRQVDSVIRFRLLRAGLGRETLAKAEARLPPSWAEGQRLELDLISTHSSQPIGKIDVSLGTWAVTKGGLKQCIETLGADLCESAALVSPVRVARGVVDDAACERGSVAQVVQGMRDARVHAGR